MKRKLIVYPEHLMALANLQCETPADVDMKFSSMSYTRGDEEVFYAGIASLDEAYRYAGMQFSSVEYRIRSPLPDVRAYLDCRVQIPV